MRGRCQSRRRFLRSAGVASLALATGCGRLPPQAQPAQVYRLGWLVAAGSAPADGFRTALGELGYVEGRNVVFEFRSAEGRDERLAELAAELVRVPVNLLLVVGECYPSRPARDSRHTHRDGARRESGGDRAGRQPRKARG